MKRALMFVVAAFSAVACSDEEPLAADASVAGDATVVYADAAVVEADAAVVTECGYGDCTCIDLTVCENRVLLTTNTTLTNQDTANGGFGDCTRSASGSGGRNLYYALVVPANDSVKVVITPSTAGTDLLLRELLACGDSEVTHSDRGGGLTQGAATLCLTGQGVERTALLAAGIYGGPPTAVFNLSVELIAAGQGCQ